MSWGEIEFEALYAIPSKNGLNRPARVRGSGFKMINMGELFANDRIGDINMELVPMNERELLSMLVEPGDLLFARQSLVLAGAGKCSMVTNVSEPTTFESHIIRVRLKKEITDPVFFYYYFKSPMCRIRSIVTQGVQAGIRGNDLKKLKVHVPTISEQTRIASILSAYDNLIENNRRRIQLLEQAARLLYKEWFVHLRFPGHEHVKIVDGVPEGWEIGTVADFFDTTSGGTPSRKRSEFFEGDINWVKTQELNEDFIFETGEKITTEALSKSSAKLFPSETLLVSIYGGTNIGRTAILAMPSASNQACVALFPRHPSSNFIFAQLFFQINRESLIGIAQGAAQTNISQQTLRKVSMIMPSKALMQNFLVTLVPVYDQLKNLKLQNMRLEESRDILLPRLMNGEVAV